MPKNRFGEMDAIDQLETLPECGHPTLTASLNSLEGVQSNNGVYTAWVKGTCGENDPEIFLIGIYDSCYQASYHRVLFIEETVSSFRPRVVISEDDLKMVS